MFGCVFDRDKRISYLTRSLFLCFFCVLVVTTVNTLVQTIFIQKVPKLIGQNDKNLVFYKEEKTLSETCDGFIKNPTEIGRICCLFSFEKYPAVCLVSIFTSVKKAVYRWRWSQISFFFWCSFKETLILIISLSLLNIEHAPSHIQFSALE